MMAALRVAEHNKHNARYAISHKGIGSVAIAHVMLERG
jgi:hypothetical protein